MTKKIYSDCTELACPIEKNIPDWDTESKALVDEFDAYIKKDEIKRCKEGEKRFKDAKPEEPFPRKYAECIDGY